VATILAAQSTDKMINTLTPALFQRYPDATALADAEPEQLEQLIHSSGFYRAKARHLLGMARAVVERHGGEVPDTMEALVALPGVARKTANVVLGTAFGKAVGIVVDTHVTRLSARLGLTEQTDPVKIELDLCELLPRSEWVKFPDRLIWHGRRVCFAKKPLCDTCRLAPLCPSAGLGEASGDVSDEAAAKGPAKAPSAKAAATKAPAAKASATKAPATKAAGAKAAATKPAAAPSGKARKGRG
jgi:endonuclease-3